MEGNKQSIFGKFYMWAVAACMFLMWEMENFFESIDFLPTDRAKHQF